jgi:fucose 4-O-acetylase-like acetyltransferase
MFKFMYPYFQVGYLLASRKPLKWSKSSRLCLSGGALAVAVTCYLFWNRSSYIYFSGMRLVPENFWNIGIRYLGGFSGSILAIEALQFLYGKLSRRIEKGIEVLGRDSIYIYILQGYVYIVVGRLSAKWMPPIGEGVLQALLGILLGILVAAGCWLAGFSLIIRSWGRSCSAKLRN